MRHTDHVLGLLLAVAGDMPARPAGGGVLDEGLDFRDELIHALGDLLWGPFDYSIVC